MEIEKSYNEVDDPAFIAELEKYRRDFVGGPTASQG
jgi:tryptophan synthase beta subunit